MATATTPRESLYDITAFIERLDAILDAQEGELTPEQEAAFDALHEKFSDTVQDAALHVRELRAKAEAVGIEVKRLVERGGGLSKRADRIEAMLLHAMQRTATLRVNGTLVTVALQQNNPKVEPLVPLDDTTLQLLESVCPGYVRREESWALDRKAILDRMRFAKSLPEALARLVKVVQTTRVAIK